MSTDNRNRVHKGVSTGGQFAQESRTEDSSITLAGPSSALDDAVLDQLEFRARQEAAKQLGRWQRSVDNPRDPYSSGKMYDEANYPDGLKQVIEESNNFKTLSREDQARISGPHMAHLLEPNQAYGNDRVKLVEGFDPDPGLAVLGLAAQRKMAESRIPGEITFTALEDLRAEFEVVDQGLTHRVHLHEGATTFAAADAEDGDHADWEWRYRAGVGSYGPDVHTSSAKDLGSNYQQYHEAAVASDVMSKSPLREAYGSLSMLDHRNQTVLISDEGTEFTLHADTDKPMLTSPNGDKLHPTMVSGFLDHVARQNDIADGATLFSGLRDAFLETRRRIVR